MLNKFCQFCKGNLKHRERISSCAPCGYREFYYWMGEDGDEDFFLFRVEIDVGKHCVEISFDEQITQIYYKDNEVNENSEYKKILCKAGVIDLRIINPEWIYKQLKYSNF
jgi:hypothetical protein